VSEIVSHAYATVPFYRRVMGQRGLRPGDFRTAADLALLPVVTGRDLAGDPEQFLSAAVAGEPLLQLWTSGSSGHAKRIFWDRTAVFRVQACGVWHRDVIASFVGRTRGYRALVVDRPGGTRDLVMAFVRDHSWLPAGLGTVQVQASLADSFERNLELINSVRPDVIRGFSGYLGALFRWASATGRRFARPRLIWCGGESLPEPDRRLIVAELGIPLIESYQACEALRIAFQCERGEGFHIHADQVVVRVVDASGATVRPGRSGRVLISNLLNRATVLLNYDLGDLGTLSESPCACGRALPMLARLDGRDDDFLARADGGVVHTSVVLSTLYAVPGVLRLQLVQAALDRFHLRVVLTGGHDGWERTRAALARALASLMGEAQITAEIERVGEIASEPSGKFKIIICKVPPGGRR